MSTDGRQQGVAAWVTEVWGAEADAVQQRHYHRQHPVPSMPPSAQLVPAPAPSLDKFRSARALPHPRRAWSVTAIRLIAGCVWASQLSNLGVVKPAPFPYPSPAPPPPGCSPLQCAHAAAAHHRQVNGLRAGVLHQALSNACEVVIGNHWGKQQQRYREWLRSPGAEVLCTALTAGCREAAYTAWVPPSRGRPT